jgi:hypothetical protein
MREFAQRFKSWQALLAFGLVACPVPFLGQVCVVAALIWRARLVWTERSARFLSLPASN